MTNIEMYLSKEEYIKFVNDEPAVGFFDPQNGNEFMVRVDRDSLKYRGEFLTGQQLDILPEAVQIVPSMPKKSGTDVKISVDYMGKPHTTDFEKIAEEFTKRIQNMGGWK